MKVTLKVDYINSKKGETITVKPSLGRTLIAEGKAKEAKTAKEAKPKRVTKEEKETTETKVIDNGDTGEN